MASDRSSRIPAQLLDLSLSGCLVATDCPLDEGTVGDLRVTLHGKEYQDTVSIVRTTERQGASHTFMAGGRFAWGNRPGTASV